MTFCRENKATHAKQIKSCILCFVQDNISIEDGCFITAIDVRSDLKVDINMLNKMCIKEGAISINEDCQSIYGYISYK